MEGLFILGDLAKEYGKLLAEIDFLKKSLAEDDNYKVQRMVKLAGLIRELQKVKNKILN